LLIVALPPVNYPEENSINNNGLRSSDGYWFVRPDVELPQICEKILARDISQNTKKALKSDWMHFANWMVDINVEEFIFQRLITSDITRYKDYCQRTKEYTPKTINRRLSSLKILCDTAMEDGMLKENPFRGIKQLPSQALAPKGLNRQELNKLLREVELRGNMRDVLVLQILCGAGLRVSELTNLKNVDVQINDRSGHMNIRYSKGGKSRRVPLNARLRDLITRYREKYQPQDYLMMGQRGHLTPIAINKIVEVYAKKAEVKCTPHSLRHTFAYNYLAENPSDIVGLSQILGHSNLNTTAIYTQRRLEDLQKGVEGMQY